MRGFMRVIQTDGFETVTEYDRCPTLPEHQAALGGHMEIVPHWDRLETDPSQTCVAYVGSGAKGAEGGVVLAENWRATDEWERICMRNGLIPAGKTLRDYDWLAGPVIVLWGDAAFMMAL